MGKEIVEITTHKPDARIVSLFESQLEELAECRNPAYNQEQLQKEVAKLAEEIKPVFIKFSGRTHYVKMLPENEFVELKTARNKYLITEEEQQKLYDLTVSIAGMSVGSSILYGLAGSSFGNSFCLADFDTFSTSNMNRVPLSIDELTSGKARTAAHRALSMNPFLSIHTVTEALTDANLDEFMASGTADIVFEEIDDFKMKIVIREYAKQKRIPLVMLTSVADTLQIDVERYDIDPDMNLFNGQVSDETIERIKTLELTDSLRSEFAASLVDRSLLTDRAKQSLAQVGKTLAGRPQLYSTVSLNVGLGSFIVRKIFIDNLNSGRYFLRLESVFS